MKDFEGKFTVQNFSDHGSSFISGSSAHDAT